MKKSTAIILCFLLLIQTFAGVAVQAFAVEGETSGEILFEDSFDYDCFQKPFYDETKAFEAEYAADSTDDYGFRNLTAPVVSNGGLHFTKGDGLRLNWQKLDGFSTFDNTKTYTLSFDLIIDAFGNDILLENTTSNNREFYFAPGGYYNQIEIRNGGAGTQGFRAGDATSEYTQGGWNTNTALLTVDTVYSCIIEWKPAQQSIISTIKSGDTLIAKGIRTNASYGTVDRYTRSFVWRCEDGNVTVDNILFTDGSNIYNQTFNEGGDLETTFFSEHYGWETEYKTDTSENYGYLDSTCPQVINGSLNFTKGDGLRLNWQELPEFSTFDSAKKYTLSFDLTVTDFGTNEHLPNLVASNREFYFAPGGYYNQIEFRNADSYGNTVGIRAGDATSEYTQGGFNTDLSQYQLNTVYSCIVEWNPSEQSIVSTVKNGDTIIAKGIRTGASYGTVDRYTRSFVWRCEDGSISLDNLVFTDGSNIYSEDFDAENIMSSSGVWEVEHTQKNDAVAPILYDGALRLRDQQSVQFNWTKVPDAGDFDSANIYTFEFDAKITDKGDGSYWDSENHTRALYVSFGGWWNLLELPDRNNQVTLCGSSSLDFDDATYLNKNLHITIQWSGTTAYTYIADENGSVVAFGSRTNQEFLSMTDSQGAMTNLVLRCEDGGVDIDNFRFSVAKNIKIGFAEVEIPSNKQAEYTAQVNFDGNQPVSVRYGQAELFAVSVGGMVVGSKSVRGTVLTGTYDIKANINPDQEMVSVEVITPDGSVVRRGMYTLFGGTVIEVYSTSADALINQNLVYTDISVNEYALTTTEPTATGFGAKVYNIVSSFDDAKTTRNFAWTAQTSFIGSSGVMAIQYRIAGSDTWNVTNAVRETEKLDTADEDFFKCDLTGLTANTEYEYRIGKKGSTDYTNDWSEIYTFTTSPETVDEFSFLAVGDTQGITWDGTTEGYKGFMYAKAAIDEAFEDISNPAFLLHTGDVVETASNRNLWNMYFKALGENGATTPHFAALGNHDAMIAGDHTYFDLHFNHPNNGGIAALDQTEITKITDANLKYVAQNADETIYSYNYGNAHFIVLNTGNYTSDDQYILEAQRQWLINDLEANKDAQWTVMLIHEPVYHRIGGIESRPTLSDVIEGYGVDLVIQGHSHLSTRTYPMKDGQIASKSVADDIPQGMGTVYTTIGSTALNHDGLNDTNHIEEIFSMAIPTPTQSAYTTVSVNNDQLVVTTKQINGLVLDQFTIKADTEEQDRAAAESVDNLIEAIGTVTLDSEETINTARNAYDALNSTQQSYVTKLDILVAAEEELKRLQEEAEIIYGDVSGNEAVTTEDALMALQHAVGKTTLNTKQILAADVQGKDGVVDSKDALMILQYATGRIESF